MQTVFLTTFASANKIKPVIDGIKLFKIWKVIVVEIEQVKPAQITRRRKIRRRTCVVSNLRLTGEETSKYKERIKVFLNTTKVNLESE